MKKTSFGYAIAGLLLTGISQAQDYSEDAHYGSTELASGFSPDPHVMDIQAGGSTNAANGVSGCTGHISTAPDLNLHYTSGEYIMGIFVNSGVDTTLVVNDPEGNWHCNDDHDLLSNNNPGIEFSNPQSGRYDIWVGVYSSDNAFSPAQLVISEMASERWNGLELSDSTSDNGNTTSDAGIEHYFGEDDNPFSQDNECDDPRYSGIGMASQPQVEHRYRDASDCRGLFNANKVAPNGFSLTSRESSLDSGDPVYSGNNSYSEVFRITVEETALDQHLVAHMKSGAFDTYLILRTPGGEEYSNDDYLDSLDASLIDIIAREAGEYEIIATSFSNGETGAFTLDIDAPRSLPRASEPEPAEPEEPEPDPEPQSNNVAPTPPAAIIQYGSKHSNQP